MAPLTADVDPFPPMAGLQGRHDAAPGTSRFPAFPEAAFLVALKYVSVFTNQWTKSQRLNAALISWQTLRV